LLRLANVVSPFLYTCGMYQRFESSIHWQDWLSLLLRETVILSPCLRVYVSEVRVHVDFNSRFWSFWRTQTDDPTIDSPALWPTKLVLHRLKYNVVTKDVQIVIFVFDSTLCGLQVGLDLVKMNVHISWNLAYNPFYRIILCGNKLIVRQYSTHDLDAANLQSAVEHGCGLIDDCFCHLK